MARNVIRLSLLYWLSNLKWLILSLRAGLLWRKVANWLKVIMYYSSPIGLRAFKIILRDGYMMSVPRGYLFEAIAETLILNTYEFPRALLELTIVDVGASLGDFVLSVQASKPKRIYAIEPDLEIFKWLGLNVKENGLRIVSCFNQPLTESLVASICDEAGSIDFLKIDCEGCEYELLRWSPDIFRRINRISMETHVINGHQPRELTKLLGSEQFNVREKMPRNMGTYLFAQKVKTPS